MKIFNIKTYYIFTSFIAGFSVMTVELISSRIVAPIIGSSVFTWTSVIGITLLGLSIGSWVGGMLADKFGNKKTLSRALLISSMLVFIIPILSKNTNFLINTSNSILWLNLFLSTYLFLLPATSIGTIQPIILKIFADDFSKIGSRYGLLSAVWSIGSVLGVFLTGFVFISTIGSAETIFFIAVILLLTGIMFTIDNKKNAIFIIITIVMFVLFFLLQQKTVEQTKMVFQKETNYYLAKVIDLYLPDFGQSRMLLLDIDSHSIQPEKKSEYFYPEIYPVFSNFKKEIRDILVIGAGAYTMPKYFKEYYNNSNVSVVEIDSEMEKIGEDYFNLKKYDINTITGDAKIIINKDTKKYDLIFGDAYSSFISVPWYLLTKEWNEEVKNKLHDNGIYAVNFIGSLIGDESEFTKSVITTFKLSFLNYYIFTFGLEPEKTQNIVLIGINGVLPLKEVDLYTKLKQENSFLYKRMAPTNYFINSSSTIITNNFAPVEKLMMPIMWNYLPKYMDFIKNITQD